MINTNNIKRFFNVTIFKVTIKIIIKVTSIIIPLSLATLCNVSFAQSPQSPPQQSPMLNQNVVSAEKQLQQKLSQVSGFSAKFNQQVVDNSQQVLQISTGKIDLIQPDKFKWFTDAPNENLLQSDGQTVWFYDPFVEQVTAYDFLSTITENPILLLMEPDSAAWRGYNVTQVDNLFMVKPKNLDSQVLQLSILFNAQNEISRLELIDRQQQTSTYQISEYQAKDNDDFPLDYFQFVMPAGTDLDDQRQAID